MFSGFSVIRLVVAVAVAVAAVVVFFRRTC